MTSHVLEIVERICTHVGIIANGELVEQTSLEELRRGSSLEQRFLEKVGRSDDEKVNLAWLEDRPVQADVSSPPPVLAEIPEATSEPESTSEDEL